MFGEIIPGFADVRVYIGGTHGFPDWLDRQQKAITFLFRKIVSLRCDEFSPNQ